MKKIFLSILILTSVHIYSQSLPFRIVEQNDKIYVLYGNRTEVIPKGEMEAHSNGCIAPNKKFITDLVTDLEVGSTQIAIYNLNTKVTNYVVKSSYDCLTGGSPITYKNSKKYPFPTICGISQVIFNSNSNKLFFMSKAWKVSNAIHVYDIVSKQIAFLCAGSIINAKSNGNLIVDISGVDINGRWTQNVEINLNGQIIATIGNKLY